MLLYLLSKEINTMVNFRFSWRETWIWSTDLLLPICISFQPIHQSLPIQQCQCEVNQKCYLINFPKGQKWRAPKNTNASCITNAPRGNLFSAPKMHEVINNTLFKNPLLFSSAFYTAAQLFHEKNSLYQICRRCTIETCSHNATSPISLIRQAICALLAASAITQKSFSVPEPVVEYGSWL